MVHSRLLGAEGEGKFGILIFLCCGRSGQLSAGLIVEGAHGIGVDAFGVGLQSLIADGDYGISDSQVGVKVGHCGGEGVHYGVHGERLGGLFALDGEAVFQGLISGDSSVEHIFLVREVIFGLHERPCAGAYVDHGGEVAVRSGDGDFSIGGGHCLAGLSIVDGEGVGVVDRGEVADAIV